MSAAVIAKIERMTRWGPDAKGRLMQSALELYAKRGYDQTTVAEIAQRAGLTERTFFRHFTDKREVLFGGSEVLRELLVDRIAAAPPSVPPVQAVTDALAAAGAMMQGRREHSVLRQAVIDANPE